MSLKQKKLPDCKTAKNRCRSCFNPYDQVHQPVTICSRGHAICVLCSIKRRLCPFCTEPIEKSRINFFDDQPSSTIQQKTQNICKEGFQKWKEESIQRRSEDTHGDSSHAKSEQKAIKVKYEPTRLTKQQKNEFTFKSHKNHQRKSIFKKELDHSRPDQHLPVYPFNHQDQFENEVNWDRQIDEKEINYLRLIFLIQGPFIIFNIYFALTYPESKCMDLALVGSSTSLLGFLVELVVMWISLRHWLALIGLFQMSMIAVSLVLLLRYKLGYVSKKSFKSNLQILWLIGMLEFVIWTFVEIGLFFQIINMFCSRGIHIYGMVLMTVQSSIFLVLYFTKNIIL